MPLYEMNNFTPAVEDHKVQLSSEIPKDLDIFWRGESYFLPTGKTFADLTTEELYELKQKYRFDYLRPGLYQAITWIGNL